MLSTLRVIETMEGTFLLTVKLKFKNSFLLDMKAGNSHFQPFSTE